MKATGIVRRIDDLGRVVIPKEIRRTLRIREGEPLEIFTDRDGEVIFKKYSPMGELGALAGQYGEAMHKTTGLSVVISDRDAVVASAGVKRKELADKNISDELDRAMAQRKTYVRENDNKTIDVVEGIESPVSVAVPIITGGDIIGSVAILAKDSNVATDTEIKLAQTAAEYLGRHFEN